VCENEFIYKKFKKKKEKKKMGFWRENVILKKVSGGRKRMERT